MITVLLVVGLVQSWLVAPGRSLFPWLDYSKLTKHFRRTGKGPTARRETRKGRKAAQGTGAGRRPAADHRLDTRVSAPGSAPPTGPAWADRAVTATAAPAGSRPTPGSTRHGSTDAQYPHPPASRRRQYPQTSTDRPPYDRPRSRTRQAAVRRRRPRVTAPTRRSETPGPRDNGRSAT